MSESQTPVSEYYLVGTHEFEHLLRTNYLLAQSTLLFQHLCSQSDRPMVLSARKVCEVLGIDNNQLEQCRKRRLIKARAFQQQFMYDAYDLLRLSEQLNLRKLQRKLSRLPRFTIR